jgi:hypothetical protein
VPLRLINAPLESNCATLSGRCPVRALRARHGDFFNSRSTFGSIVDGNQTSQAGSVYATRLTGDLPGVSDLQWRRPLAETNEGIHIVALLEMGIQVHWAVENVLSYSTRP